jgi:DNA invertase Pin-like site-specific DNA recombinase
MKIVIAYERVSTRSQTTDAQALANQNYARANSLPVSRWISETVSGSTPWRNRELAHVFDGAARPTDLLVYELSRVGRNLSDILDFLQNAIDAGITIHVTSKGTTISAGIYGKILSVVLALCAEIEREHLRERTRAALDERRAQLAANGFYISKAGHRRTTLGRQPGTPRARKLESKRDEVMKLHRAKVSDSAIARLTSVDRKTVARFIAETKKSKETNNE